MKAIAGEFDETPDGHDWHAQLLSVFSEGNSLSGLVLLSDLRLSLAALMRFRHVFRHIYVLDIDGERLKPLLADFAETERAFEFTLKNWLSQPS